MRLIVLVPHTYDGHSYAVGDSYEVADDLSLSGSPVTVADTILGNGMARAATPADSPPTPAAVPPAPPSDPPAPPHNAHAKHRKAGP